MAYTAPTIATFKTRFPVFGGVADDVLQLVLDEAIDRVGEDWPERFRTRAQLYLTAHLLAAEGVAGASPGGGWAAVTGAIRSRKVGDVAIEFSGQRVAEGASTFNSTQYGKEYLRIMRGSFPTMMVV